MTTPRSKSPQPKPPKPQCLQSTEKNIPMKRKFVSTYACNTLHEKTEFLQEHQIWLGRLSIP